MKGSPVKQKPPAKNVAVEVAAKKPATGLVSPTTPAPKTPLLPPAVAKQDEDDINEVEDDLEEDDDIEDENEDEDEQADNDIEDEFADDNKDEDEGDDFDVEGFINMDE